MRRLLMGAVVTTVVLVLSACIRIDADMTVQSSGIATGEFTIELSEQVAALTGITSSEKFAEEFNSGGLDESGSVPLPTGEVDCAPAEATDAFAITCTFTDVEFSTPDESWWITTAEDSVTFHTRNQSENDESAADFLGEDFSLGGITFDVTMPGTITSIEGDFVEQKTDTSFQVEASLSDSFDIAVTSDKGSSSSVPPWLWIVLAVVVIAALVVAFAVLSRRKKTTPDPEPTTPAGPTD